MDRREFLHILSAAALGGAFASSARSADLKAVAADLYDMPKFGQVSICTSPTCTLSSIRFIFANRRSISASAQ